MDTNTKEFINEARFEELNNLVEQAVILNPNMNIRVTALYDGIDSQLTEVSNFLTEEFNNGLLTMINNADWIPVGLDGIKDNYKDGDKIGSYRLSIFNEFLAEKLTEVIKEFYPTILNITDTTYTDAPLGTAWELDGINPLFRFIRYKEDGLLVPHYDGSYKPSDEYRSLVTLVMYLEGAETTDDGATQFIHDDNVINKVPKEQIDRSDWTRIAKEDEVICASNVVPCKAVLFDHWLLHDSKPLGKSDKRKTIIRTDLMYRKVGDY